MTTGERVSPIFSGSTNTDVLAGPGPDVIPAVPESDSPVTTLVLFGRTPERIASMAGVLANWMTGEGAEVELADVAHTLNHHRAWQAKFATVCARTRAQAVAGLAALAAGRPAEGVVGPHEGPCGPGTVFVYSGQGSQWAGMGRRLLADEPAFAAAVAELEPIFVEQVGFSLRQALASGEPLVGEARVQPVLMGLQLALTELWRNRGMIPDAVIGHSMGEVTAAVVVRALSAADGLRVIVARSRLMARLAGQGAAHTASMDPILPELRLALADITPKEPVVPFISAVTDTGTIPVLDAEYWVANLRRPVRLRETVAIAAQNNATFIEISAHPILTHAIAETLVGGHHHSVGTLWRDGDDTLSFRTNLNATHGIYPPETPHPAGPHPMLPTATPWQRTRLSDSIARARRRIEVVQSRVAARRGTAPSS